MANANLIDSLVPGSQEIVMSRTFDAPKELVFRALTDPAAIPKWWGPRRFTTTVDVMEAAVRWTLAIRPRRREGKSARVSRRVSRRRSARSNRLHVRVRGNARPRVARDDQTLDEVDGKTTLTESSVFQSVADRDGMMAAGMESGATESMDRLGELLETMR